MIRKACRVLPALVLLLFATGEALAGGAGLYAAYGQGTLSARRDGAAGEYSFDQTATHKGGGLVYDSNVLEDRAFNWRLGLGYEQMDAEVDGGDGPFTDGLESSYKGRLLVENDFGYGTKPSPRVRLWGGATTRLSFYSGQDESHIGPRDQKVFGAGVGPVVGVNVAVTGNWALSLKAGYLLSYYQGRWTDWSATPRSRGDMSATEGSWFAGIAVLTKTGPLSWGDDDGEEKEDF